MTRIALADLAARAPPAPWRDGDNIPWHVPAFSRRMLREHLSPHHDAGSRRPETIDAQVTWVHSHLLLGRPGRVLDLGCGPGLYASRLARLGHDCTGIDYSPASIEYAVEGARREGLRCAYRCEDIRSAEYGEGFELVMLISGELNVFRPADALAILKKARAALGEGGLLLLEPHTEAAVRETGARGRGWYARERGVFSDRPHAVLQEHAWDEATRSATVRYLVIDGATDSAELYAQTFQCYSDGEYRALLNDCGLTEIERFPSLRGAPDDSQPALFVLTARA